MGAEQYRDYASELLKGTGTNITSFKFLYNEPEYYSYLMYNKTSEWRDIV